ncbi:hypothetical protein SAMN05443665_1021115 [Actinomadura meyerae]|uniref:Uncharacterized protein n=1 Tax=Actinomadura meyerae TaxID=240840 RepID=A0A239L9L8_9ACTN|nr:hypothetical protein SAMN05443665_1021115 [Actinomadura meyerae]
MSALVSERRSGTSVYLHVGAPTAGTAYLHRVLWDNRRRLADGGVCYPVAGPQEHFGAVMDLREMSWGGRRDPAWDGAWARVAERAREWDGPAVVFSQGLLAGATEEQVKRAVAALEPADVHVVFATRGWGWQLALDWQEQILHAHTVAFERFADDLVKLGVKAPEPYGEMFWGLHDPVRVLAAWESAVPKERIHVLTLPAPGGGPSVLWDRFRAVTGIGADVCDTAGIPADEPLTAVEAELLRRLNERIGPALGEDYERVVRTHFLDRTTSGTKADRTPMGLPARHAEWAAARTRETVASLRASGYDVVGDLAELEAGPAPRGGLVPDEVPDELLATATVEVAAHLLEELSMTRERVGLAHLHGELAGIRENMRELMEAAADPSPALRRAARRAARRRGR